MGISGAQVAVVGGLALWWWRDSDLVLIVAAVAIILLGLLLLPVRGSEPLALLLLRRVRFARGRRVGLGRTEAATVRLGRDSRGHTFGVVERYPTVSVVLRVSSTRAPGLSVGGTTHRLPLEDILSRLQNTSVPIDSVCVLRGTPGQRVGEAGDSVVGTRHTDLAIRLVYADLPLAVAERGGGQVGLDACLSIVATLAATAVRSAGLEAEVLGPDHLNAQIAADLGGGLDAVAEGTEAWGHLQLPDRSHRILTVTAMDRASRLDALQLVAGADVSLVTQIRMDEAGAPRLGTLVRVGAPDPQMVREASKAVVAVGRQCGVRLRAMNGHHRWGTVECGLLGSATTASDRGVTGVPQPAQPAWIRSAGGVDEISPRVHHSIAVGTRPADGALARLDAVASPPMHWVLIGGIELAADLARRVSALGLSVLVRSEDPDRWSPHLPNDADSIVLRSQLQPGADGSGPLVVMLDNTGARQLGQAVLERSWITVVEVYRNFDRMPQRLVDPDTTVLIAPGAAPHPRESINVLGLAPPTAVQLARSSASRVAVIKARELTLLDPSINAG